MTKIISLNMERGGAMYIVTNTHHTTLYVGVGEDLYSRIIEHRTEISQQLFGKIQPL